VKRALRISAVMVALAASFVWVGLGANRGWTKTQVPVKTLDQVTGIEGVSYRQKFEPGVDFLGAGFLLAGALGGSSIFIRKPNHNP